jgi:DNA-binding NarL/FixJ family response regulator
VAVRVVLVEDNRLYRETLGLLLGQNEGIDVVASVEGVAEGAALCGELAPDVVMIDYRMPGVDGARATREVLGASPRSRVICLTASVTQEERELVLGAGAVACLRKDEDLDRIVDAILAVAADTPG